MQGILVDKESIDAMEKVGKQRMESCMHVDKDGMCWGAKLVNGKPAPFKPWPMMCALCPKYKERKHKTI